DRQRRKPLVLVAGRVPQLADLTDRPRGHRDEITGRQPIVGAPWVRRGRSQRAGRDDVGRSGGDEQSLLEPAPLAFARERDELVLFQRPKVVVHLLPGDADPRRQRGGRGGLAQFGKQSAAGGVEGTDRRSGIGDDLDVEHSCIVSLTSLFVKARGYLDGMELLPLRGRRRGIRQIGLGLGTLDREVFEAIAESPSPLLDATMPRLSRAADLSKLWLAIAAAIAAFGGP